MSQNVQRKMAVLIDVRNPPPVVPMSTSHWLPPLSVLGFCGSCSDWCPQAILKGLK